MERVHATIRNSTSEVAHIAVAVYRDRGHIAASKGKQKPFSPSLVNQMLSQLTDSGLVYKNRHGKYSLAVPLLAQFIRRQRAQVDPMLFP